MRIQANRDGEGQRGDGGSLRVLAKHSPMSTARLRMSTLRSNKDQNLHLSQRSQRAYQNREVQTGLRKCSSRLQNDETPDPDLAHQGSFTNQESDTRSLLQQKTVTIPSTSSGRLSLRTRQKMAHQFQTLKQLRGTQKASFSTRNLAKTYGATEGCRNSKEQHALVPSKALSKVDPLAATEMAWKYPNSQIAAHKELNRIPISQKDQSHKFEGQESHEYTLSKYLASIDLAPSLPS